MSRNYDNWEKLVGAVLRREKDRQLAYCESFATSYSADLSSRFSSDFTVEDADFSFNTFVGAVHLPSAGDVVVEIGSLGSIKLLEIGGRSDCGDYVSFDRILPAFQSLRELRLYGMEEWDGLPEQLQHLTTLHYLWLIGFGIEVLPEWLERLSSLRELEVWECKKLRHLPSKKAMQALTKLKDLNIYDCPLLQQELKQQGSDDDSEWSKVSHIPHVYVS